MRCIACWSRCFLIGALALLALPESGWAKTYAETLMSEGALHYWSFDELSADLPAKDFAPPIRPAFSHVPEQKNTPGDYQDGVTVGVPSAYPGLGTAVQYNGTPDSYVDLGTPQHPCNSISLEAWIRMDESATTGNSPIFSRWDGSYELGVKHTEQGSFLNFKVRNNDNVLMDVLSTETLQVGQWYHVMGAFLGVTDFGPGTASVYINGVRQGPVVGGGDLRDAGGDDGKWYVGKSAAAGSTTTWKGAIDEIAIYPYELGAGQILNRMELAKGVVALPGDFNADGKLDVLDIDLLSTEMRAGTNTAKFDLTGDAVVNADDHRNWVTTLKKTWYGDATLDGIFDTGDLVTVFQAGKFESDVNATWAEGDWDGDGRFGSGDLVLAFQDGGFEVGARPAIAAVPEPHVAAWTLLCGLFAMRRRSKRS